MGTGFQNMERLEGRFMLAGNVVAREVDGHLIIIGDAGDDSISIQAVPGGFHVAGDDGTTVNGSSSVEVGGVTKDLRVHLKGGRNLLRIDGVSIARDLKIVGGSGDDRITVKDATIGRRFSVETLQGDDALDLINVVVGEKTIVGMSAGRDIFTADGSTFKGRFHLNTGAGDDALHLLDNTFEGRRRIVPGSGRDQVSRSVLSLDFDFSRGAQGWRPHLADFSRGMRNDLQFQHGIRPLPSGLGSGRGYFVQTMNRSDDLFVYLWRELRGLRPGQTYQVNYQITFASEAPSGGFGVGGAPGEAVILKAGASSQRPSVTLDDSGTYRTNIDHGEQSQGGSAASNVGNIANGRSAEDPARFVSLTRNHVHPFVIKADSRGRIYLVVGTESGYEGLTRMYYQRIKVQVLPVTQQATEKTGGNPAK